jgi:O-methyltransferase
MLPTNQDTIDEIHGRSVQECRDALDVFFARHRQQPSRFAGQLAPDFQATLAAAHAGLAADDCEFRHTIETPCGRVYPGDWDLRGHETAYLGGMTLAGKSVLEFGPASGWLSAFIAASARLTVVDLPLGEAPELIPFPDADMALQRRFAAVAAGRLRNSWWFTRQRLGFDATTVYADIYALPPDLGRMDVCVLGSVLPHLSNPFRALQQAAALTDEAVVVTDTLRPGAPVGFSPSSPPFGFTHWWAVTPELVEQMLHRLGFGDVVTTLHAPPRMSPAPPMFTTIGCRPRIARRTGRPARTPAPLPVPPASLRTLVSGTEDESVFLELGALGFQALTASIRAQGIDPAALGRVLDFGCGVGRVTRYWAGLPGISMEGSDLSADMIAWDQANLPFASFRVSPAEPALDYANGRFGLVYALSVFTHLPSDRQLPWLRELLRVTRPGGLIYLSTHGPRYANLLTTDELQAFEQGNVVVTGEDRPGSNHCAAFHPCSWMQNLPAELELDILDYRPRGAWGNPEQDSWLLRRRV